MANLARMIGVIRALYRQDQSAKFSGEFSCLISYLYCRFEQQEEAIMTIMI